MANDDDRALRPLSFGDFAGQEESKRNLSIFVRSAKARNEALDHLLFTGPPGLGKTTLANIVANEMGSKMVVLNANTIKSKGALVGVLIGLSRGDVLFIDEIHSLNPKVEEVLYTAMEDYRVDVTSGEGANAKAVSLQLEPFTLIGATTRSGAVSQPLRDRFGEVIQMQLYGTEELTNIVMRSAEKLGMESDVLGAQELARRSRGTPRIANRLLRRARDFAFASGHGRLDMTTVKDTCDSLGIDGDGLDKSSRQYLEILAGRTMPVGLNTVAAMLGESEDTIEESIEPFLLRLGYVERTPKGRVATSTGKSAVRRNNAAW